MKKDNNTIRVTTLLLEQLQVPVTVQSITDELQKHPEYPGLLAISDVLSNWSIPNASYELTFEQLFTVPVPLPFIAYLNSNEFVLVHSLDENKVVISNENHDRDTVEIEKFKNFYQGAILVAEKDESSGEIDYSAKQRKEMINNVRIPFVIAGSVMLLIAYLLLNPAYTNTFNWHIGLLTLFKTAGLATTILLLVQSIDRNNPVIHKLCGGDSNKNCSAILSSNAAKISEELSWSEAGFFYFAGTWLTLLFNSGHTSLMQVLALLNLISLPYTFYSIYYQWRIEKQWCIFCCTVQAVLWIEFFAFLHYLPDNGLKYPDLREWASLLSCMGLPILAWAFIKPYLLKAVQLEPVKKQLRNFKFNAEYFEKTLNQEIKYALPPEENSIILGNREAELVVTMVSNPYCKPCAHTHKVFDEWLTNRDDIKLQIIFTPPDAKDPKWEVANHLMSLKLTQDDTSLKKAMGDWYAKKYRDYTKWSKHYPIEEKKVHLDILQENAKWCQMVNITGTPAIFINGRKLPENYQPEDIKYFI